MALFDFTFKNLRKTLEFNNSWCWFYLTDGTSNICINGKRLLSYNSDFLSDGKAQVIQHYEENQIPFYEPDYYVVRLYEDLLYDALPYTWHNVSDLMHQCLLNPKVYDLSWDMCWDRLDDSNDYDMLEKCNLRIGNFGGGHMVFPIFRLWRYADEIYIYWNGKREYEANIPYFQEVGEAIFVINHLDFMNEVDDFHRRLMQAMAQRISQLQSHGVPDDEIRQMMKEHEQREQSLEKAMQDKISFNPNFEQDNLENGINLRQLLAENPCEIGIIRVSHF